MEQPVVVEHIQAHYGIDIGQTLIGMHLKHVAVPVRTSIRQIGEAFVTTATTTSGAGTARPLKSSTQTTLLFPLRATTKATPPTSLTPVGLQTSSILTRQKARFR